MRNKISNYQRFENKSNLLFSASFKYISTKKKEVAIKKIIM